MYLPKALVKDVKYFISNMYLLYPLSIVMKALINVNGQLSNVASRTESQLNKKER
jgi:hypothetical protein